MNTTNKEHQIGKIQRGPHGDYTACACEELHPIDWAEGTVPIMDTKVKLCKTCQQCILCDQCRLLGSIC